MNWIKHKLQKWLGIHASVYRLNQHERILLKIADYIAHKEGLR